MLRFNDHILIIANHVFFRFDYVVNPDRSAKFYREIRKYFPNLKDGCLEPGYSGMRPRIFGCGQAPLDFIVQVHFFLTPSIIKATFMSKS